MHRSDAVPVAPLLGRSTSSATAGRCWSFAICFAESGGTAIAEYSSVASSSGCNNAVAAAVSAFGQLDIVVGVAGALLEGSINATDEEYQAVIFVDRDLGWLTGGLLALLGLTLLAVVPTRIMYKRKIRAERQAAARTHPI